MSREKPIIVRHPEFWRRYHSSRDLLRAITLGDLIPSHQEEWCDEPVFQHLFSRPDAAVDIIAVEDPGDEEWARVAEILAQTEVSHAYPDPLDWSAP